MAKGTKAIEETIDKKISMAKNCVKRKVKVGRDPVVYYEYLEDIYSEGKLIVMVFVEPLFVDLFEDCLVSNRRKENNLTFTVFKGVPNKLLKLYIKQLKQDYKSILYGNEIKDIHNNGFALYINWTNEGRIVLHRYKSGKFKSSLCKRTSLWETENGAWIVGIEKCSHAGDIAGKIDKFFKEGFGRELQVFRHKLCVDNKECGGKLWTQKTL